MTTFYENKNSYLVFYNNDSYRKYRRVDCFFSPGKEYVIQIIALSRFYYRLCIVIEEDWDVSGGGWQNMQAWIILEGWP